MTCNRIDRHVCHALLTPHARFAFSQDPHAAACSRTLSSGFFQTLLIPLLDSFARPDIASPRAAVSAAKRDLRPAVLVRAASSSCIRSGPSCSVHRKPGTLYFRTAGARGQLHRYVADFMPAAVNRVLDASNGPARDSRWHQCQAEPSASNPGSLGSTGLTPVLILRARLLKSSNRGVAGTRISDRRCHKK